VYTFTKFNDRRIPNVGVGVRVGVGPVEFQLNSASSCSRLSSARCHFYERPSMPAPHFVLDAIVSCQTDVKWSDIRFNCAEPSTIQYSFIGPIPWGHSGPLCRALSLSSSLSLSSLMSWTSMRRRRATVPVATPGEWA